MSETPPLVSTEWLAANMWQPNVVVADASWYLPQAGRNARAEYRDGHIPGAVFFDIDAISDQKTDLPHMLPDPIVFASAMRKLGIGDSDRVVFYDGAGL
jgi:thiosulfate/3-mercaptopyruvate sulfurtransferase